MRTTIYETYVWFSFLFFENEKKKNNNNSQTTTKGENENLFAQYKSF